MAYKDLVLNDKDNCLQYSEAIEIIYNNITTEMCLYKKNYLKGVQFMLYELVTKILDLTKENKTDVLTGADIAVAKYPEQAEAYRDASKKLSKYYEQITSFRRDNKPEKIKELCDLIESGNEAEIKLFLDKHEEYFKQSFEKAKK